MVRRRKGPEGDLLQGGRRSVSLRQRYMVVGSENKYTLGIQTAVVQATYRLSYNEWSDSW